MTILIFIISLALLILVHEFGHFIVAKKSGIRVDEFGLGFPPKLIAKKWGETTYTLNAIPFGGFVKIFGEDPERNSELESSISNGAGAHKDRNRNFQYKSKWIQAAVLVAGVTMNMVFAWFLISLGFMIGLPTPVDSGLGKVKDPHVVVVEVMPNSPAEKAGLHVGDTILSVVTPTTAIKDFDLTVENAQNFIKNSQTNIGIVYTRGNSPLATVVVEPNTTIVPGQRAIGIGMDMIGTLRLSPPRAVLEGAKTTWLLTKGTVVGLGTFLYHIVTLQGDFSQVSGPIGIAKVVGEARVLGFVYLLSLVALISINLAIINLLPFPALDGGRLLFVGIEAIIRRPISPKVVRYANGIGFAFLLMLMVLVTGHDIIKLF